jgi:hypothetical protein
METITKDYLDRVMSCFKNLHETDDILTFMIRGHLHCESVLTALLSKAIQRPEALDVDRLNYQAKLNLCNAFGLIPESLEPGLAKLGKFRNQLVHRFDCSISEQDQTDFINTLRSTGGLHTEYYLSERTDFLNGLRRCIEVLLIELALQLADTVEQREDMLVSLSVLAVKVNGSELNDFIARMKKNLIKFFSRKRGK